MQEDAMVCPMVGASERATSRGRRWCGEGWASDSDLQKSHTPKSQRSHQLAPRAHAPPHPAEPLRILARPLGAERREPLAPLPLALAHQRRLLVASPL